MYSRATYRCLSQLKLNIIKKNHFPSYIHWILSVHEAHVTSVYILDYAEL